jgi:hypothetical protein
MKFNKYSFFLYLVFHFFTKPIYCQSKKEIREQFQIKIDSLNLVIRENNENHKIEFNKILDERNDLKIHLDALKEEQSILKKKNDSLISDFKNIKIEFDKCKQKNENLLMNFRKMSDSLMVINSILNKFEVLQFRRQNDDRYASAELAIIQVSPNEIKGFIGWSAQGTSYFYIEGKFKLNSYIGKVYSIGLAQEENQELMNSIGDFEIVIKDSKLLILNQPINYPLVLGNSILPSIIDGELIHFDNQSDVYLDKNINSKILYHPKEGEPEPGFKIIEIGNLDLINGKNFIWYKIKTDKTTGWVYGEPSLYNLN